MSDEQDRIKHSKRLYDEQTAIEKQVKIAKEHHMDVKDKHRFHKHHALDCGNPKCTICSNPRKIFKDLTAQEKRLFQDVDEIRYKKSNGNLIKESND